MAMAHAEMWKRRSGSDPAVGHFESFCDRKKPLVEALETNGHFDTLRYSVTALAELVESGS